MRHIFVNLRDGDPCKLHDLCCLVTGGSHVDIAVFIRRCYLNQTDINRHRMLSHRDWLRVEMDWNRFSSALLQTFSVVRAVEERVDYKMLVAILCCIRCITDIQTL